MPSHSVSLSTTLGRIDGAVGSTDLPAKAPKRVRVRSMGLIAATYAVDVLLFIAFASLGTIGWSVPAIYALIGTALVGSFAWVIHAGWTAHLADPFVSLHQVIATAGLFVVMMWWVPEIGHLLVTSIFIVAAFGSLRMDRNAALVSGAFLSIVVGLVVMWFGERMSMPLSTTGERAVSSVWLTSVLVRCTLVGYYGAQMRLAVQKGRAALAHANKALEDLASRDELTGTANRRAILSLIDDARTKLEANGEPFVVALMDIDHFKRINDGHGHLVGDETLKHFASIVAGQLRGQDRLGRYGGEEFVIMLHGVSTNTVALKLADRLRQRIEAENWGTVARGLNVTVSIGVAVAHKGEATSHLLARADKALYECKNNGRNRCECDDLTAA